MNNFEDLIEKEYSNIAGIAIRKDNHLIYEKYFDGYTPDDALHIASVTKSIISILIGMAIDKGYMKNIEQHVLDFFPNYIVKRGEKTIQNITIANLLSMTAPYKYKSEPYTKVYSSDDWVKAALDLLGGKGSIGVFNYLPLAHIFYQVFLQLPLVNLFLISLQKTCLNLLQSKLPQIQLYKIKKTISLF